MPLADTLKALPDQMLEAMELTQQVVLTNLSAGTATAQALSRNLPALPFADRLPDPVLLTDQAFDFAAKVMASQKDFSVKLVAALRPIAPTAPASSKPAATKATSTK